MKLVLGLVLVGTLALAKAKGGDEEEQVGCGKTFVEIFLLQLGANITGKIARLIVIR